MIIDVRDPNSNLQPVRGEHSRPPIVISRTHPELMRRLFEQEVPEIYEAPSRSSRSPVSPASAPRSPSTRSTIAWIPWAPASAPRQPCSRRRGRAPWRARRRHPVGCRSGRLRRQRPVARQVTRVLIDEEKAYAGVIVPDDQLSLAIGKEGQNARLAARLTGWHIDIKSETLPPTFSRTSPFTRSPPPI
mgnify:CR=1 FL=1